ncbi:MAG: phosphotransferase [Verrucomicrobiae bacterium]|nr:phosphotransferase [Verrucomicrobiae bacterium]
MAPLGIARMFPASVLPLLMEIPEIEALTRAAFPDWKEAGEFSVEVIDRTGSGRRFFRLTKEGQVPDSTLFAMHYSLERRENGRFAEITRFLEEIGVPVPRILSADAENHVLWLEDLGAVDLASFQEENWQTTRAPLYRAALSAVLPLHRVGETANAPGLPELEPPFDAALYQWEQDYFFEHFAANFSTAAEAELAEARASNDLRALVDELAAEPRALLHRDFQSSNVMIRDGHAYLIDYQGLRWGVPEYDLASLLFDPYVELAAEHREELARTYHELRGAGGEGESWDRFRARLDRCACQRLMQALGAYGNLGLNKGQPGFLRHIPVAVKRLREIAIDRGAAPSLAPVLSLRETSVA